MEIGNKVMFLKDITESNGIVWVFRGLAEIHRNGLSREINNVSVSTLEVIE